MRRSFSPLIGLLVAAIMLAAVPAAFAAAPDHLPFLSPDRPAAAPPTPFDNADPGEMVAPGPDSPTPRPPHLATTDRATQPTVADGRDAPAPVPAPAATAPPTTAPGPVPEPRPVDGQAALAGIAAPEVPHAIKARCFGTVEAGVGSVECNWVGREDLAVAGWQLWNIRVRPEHGERNLVAEMRADVTTFVDTAVEVPGHYLYAVLAVDSNGGIIARSAVAPASLKTPPGQDEKIRLKCRPIGLHDRPAVDIAPADIAPPDIAPSIGCEWSAAQIDTAVGYVLWRQVDGGERVAVARTGLEATRFVDTDVAREHRYVYVATAVDASGEVVARSHEEHVGIPGPQPHPVPPIRILPDPGLPPVVPSPPMPIDPSLPTGPAPIDPPPIGVHPPRAAMPLLPTKPGRGVSPPTNPSEPSVPGLPSGVAPAGPTQAAAAPAMPRTSASG